MLPSSGSSSPIINTYEFILPLVTIINLVLAVLIANRWQAVTLHRHFRLEHVSKRLKKKDILKVKILQMTCI